ncbi:DinB family protein [uncultured Imperialibacter sp.]|uniref:DinB family protein n=1 Tax=Imperialibacter sp. TaxID=2038411 RepID=UPI0030DAF683|tara:strand:- start:1129 stop:1578 length:450 start_codon:yes stop_codon:yes gene_type:complete
METVVKDLMELFERDIDRLQKELELTPDAVLWKTVGQINNSPGNLFLHLAGNLQHFIGAVIGKTSFVRDREGEFGKKGLPKSELASELQATRKAVLETLAKMTSEQLHSNYPIEVFGKPMTTQNFLIHLSGHLNYHYGQINYFRRIVAS